MREIARSTKTVGCFRRGFSQLAGFLCVQKIVYFAEKRWDPMSPERWMTGAEREAEAAEDVRRFGAAEDSSL